MAVMQLLLTLLCLFAVAAAKFSYDIGSYVDDAVDEFNMKVKRAGDEYLALEDPLAIGGYVLERPKLADISSLESTGNAFLEPLQNGVEVYARLRFGKLHLDGWKLTGPGKNVDKPRITVRQNDVIFRAKARMETTSSWPTANATRVITKGCFATYEASLNTISSVVLVTSDKVESLDDWSEGLLGQIKELIDPFLNAVFEKHFDLCQFLKNTGYKFSTN